VSQKIKFVTFGDGSFGFRSAAKRLASQAYDSNLFSLGVEVYDLDRLYSNCEEFERSHKQYIQLNQKGLGNYIWKPQMLIQALESVKSDEIVCVIDAGCQLNLNEYSLNRFYNYIEMVDQSGSLFMQIRPGSFGNESFLDREWSKKSLMEFLDPQDVFGQSSQIQSGIIFLKHSEDSVHFAREWMQLSEYEDYSLLRSPLDVEGENPWFRGHRWEQSILSLLVKKRRLNFISDETYWYPEWNRGLNYPVWAMRNRSGGDAYRRNIPDLIKIMAAKWIT
jgi:hypothetical protein